MSSKLKHEIIIIMAIILAFVILMGSLGVMIKGAQADIYAEAEEALAAGDYITAYENYDMLYQYNGADVKKEAIYVEYIDQLASQHYEVGNFIEAINQWNKIVDQDPMAENHIRMAMEDYLNGAES